MNFLPVYSHIVDHRPYVFCMFFVTSATCRRISAWFLVDFVLIVVSLAVSSISAIDCVKTFS